MPRSSCTTCKIVTSPTYSHSRRNELPPTRRQSPSLAVWGRGTGFPFLLRPLCGTDGPLRVLCVSSTLCHAGRGWSFMHEAGEPPRGPAAAPGEAGAGGGGEAAEKGQGQGSGWWGSGLVGGWGSLGTWQGSLHWVQLCPPTARAWPLRNALYKCKFASEWGSLVQRAISVVLSVQFFTLCVSVLCLGQSFSLGCGRLAAGKVQLCREADRPTLQAHRRGQGARHSQADPGQARDRLGTRAGRGWGEDGSRPAAHCPGSRALGWGGVGEGGGRALSAAVPDLGPPHRALGLRVSLWPPTWGAQPGVLGAGHDLPAAAPPPPCREQGSGNPQPGLESRGSSRARSTPAPLRSGPFPGGQQGGLHIYSCCEHVCPSLHVDTSLFWERGSDWNGGRSGFTRKSQAVPELAVLPRTHQPCELPRKPCCPLGLGPLGRRCGQRGRCGCVSPRH